MNSLGLGLGLNRLRNIVPKEGLAAFFRENSAGDLVDTIGLSVTDKSNVRAEIWALLFDESDVAYSDAQRIINIEASIYLNCGWELMGNGEYALYLEGTAESILRKAYRYFKEPYIPAIFARYLNLSHYTNMEHYI